MPKDNIKREPCDERRAACVAACVRRAGLTPVGPAEYFDFFEVTPPEIQGGTPGYTRFIRIVCAEGIVGVQSCTGAGHGDPCVVIARIGDAERCDGGRTGGSPARLSKEEPVVTVTHTCGCTIDYPRASFPADGYLRRDVLAAMASQPCWDHGWVVKTRLAPLSAGGSPSSGDAGGQERARTERQSGG